MFYIRSPTSTFTILFSLFSIGLTIVTYFFITFENGTEHLLVLLICPPINCLLLLVFSLTWVERRSCLSYVPTICLLILLSSCLTMTIISVSSLSTSITILCINFVYYCILSILCSFVIVALLVSFGYGSLCVHRYRSMMTEEQRNGIRTEDVKPLKIDQLTLKSTNNNELILFMSALPGRRIRHDVRNIEDDLNQISVHTIITLNEAKELSFMNQVSNIYSLEIYSTYVTRANINHLIYQIRDRFIPKSISEYMEFIYNIIVDVNRSNCNRILVHCMGGMGRTGLTVVCLELVYEYIMEHNNKSPSKRHCIENFYHYPFLLTRSCRVCQAISNVRQARKGTIHNPLQILFAHEFYARLKSPSFMARLKQTCKAKENRPLINNHDHSH